MPRRWRRWEAEDNRPEMEKATGVVQVSHTRSPGVPSHDRPTRPTRGAPNWLDRAVRWRRAAEWLMALPPLLLAGLGLLGIGSAVDLVYHGLSPVATGALLPFLGEGTHLLVFVGMVVLFLGLVQRGVSHGR